MYALTLILLVLKCGRTLKVLRAGSGFFVGVSFPNVKPNSDGVTHLDESSYCMGSHGGVYAAGKCVINPCELPKSSITDADLYKKRWINTYAFAQGDEISVSLDCTQRTVKLKSPTVTHTIDIRHPDHQQSRNAWVLNVCFSYGDFELELM